MHNEKIQIYLEAQDIADPYIRKLTFMMLKAAPAYFWTVPATSTGKYHPAICQGERGLLRHTLAAVRIARALFAARGAFAFSPEEQDIIIAALLLHDCCKLGYPGAERHTVFEHPLLVARLYQPEWSQNHKEKAQARAILQAIACHMGCWNQRDGRPVMPEPQTPLERFVHLCDYLAAQGFINVELGLEELPEAGERESLAR